MTNHHIFQATKTTVPPKPVALPAISFKIYSTISWIFREFIFCRVAIKAVSIDINTKDVLGRDGKGLTSWGWYFSSAPIFVQQVQKHVHSVWKTISRSAGACATCGVPRVPQWMPMSANSQEVVVSDVTATCQNMSKLYPNTTWPHQWGPASSDFWDDPLGLLFLVEADTVTYYESFTLPAAVRRQPVYTNCLTPTSFLVFLNSRQLWQYQYPSTRLFVLPNTAIWRQEYDCWFTSR